MRSTDSEGLYVGAKGRIRTWSGARIDPLDVDPSEIIIEDVAHSLARQCRYNGHSAGHLSVARHSLWVSEHLRTRGPELELWGLLHDATEAYLGDLVKPLKVRDEMAEFRRAEENLERAVADAFDLPYPMPSAVHDADRFVTAELEMPDRRHSYFGNAEDDERDFLDAYITLRGYKLPTPKTVVIGLHGAKRVGKDSVGKILVQREGFTRLSFAGKLYATLLGTDPLVPRSTGSGPVRHFEYVRLSKVVEEIGWEQAKDEIPEVRRLLERLGTEGVRENLGHSTWIDAAVADVERGGKYVFTDVRFANEAEAIHKLGGEVWKVTRKGYEPDDSHVSNAGIPDSLISRTIANDGTLSDLRRSVIHSSH